MTAQFLVDTSAYLRLARESEVQEAWDAYVRAGRLSICELTELEIFYTAQSADHRKQLVSTIRQRYHWALVPESAFPRAAAVQELLTERGAQRSAGPVDLLVAATAEAHGMTILHYDRDFEQVARVTGQATRWIAEPGSIP
ncbi:PIN domain nuclease [Actinoplanes palleronii]|uniref:Ribonuclease VapC n=1 Tax=Actinoplanes palleronii TaxID=113570 RepID=A0ABQ4B1U5_9ACTN|nr:PIN domain nuclease [Actinoplanes palleronii]GIE64637.1 ribonuclease VapC2 [Actinoplanes palleronii]